VRSLPPSPGSLVKSVLSSLLILTPAISALTLADSEHLSPTYGTHALCGWLTILHDYALGILHFSFGAAFHTVRLHLFTSLLSMKDKLFLPILSIVGGVKPLQTLDRRILWHGSISPLEL